MSFFGDIGNALGDVAGAVTGAISDVGSFISGNPLGQLGLTALGTVFGDPALGEQVAGVSKLAGGLSKLFAGGSGAQAMMTATARGGIGQMFAPPRSRTPVSLTAPRYLGSAVKPPLTVVSVNGRKRLVTPAQLAQLRAAAIARSRAAARADQRAVSAEAPLGLSVAIPPVLPSAETLYLAQAGDLSAKATVQVLSGVAASPVPTFAVTPPGVPLVLIPGVGPGSAASRREAY